MSEKVSHIDNISSMLESVHNIVCMYKLGENEYYTETIKWKDDLNVTIKPTASELDSVSYFVMKSGPNWQFAQYSWVYIYDIVCKYKLKCKMGTILIP